MSSRSRLGRLGPAGLGVLLLLGCATTVRGVAGPAATESPPASSAPGTASPSPAAQGATLESHRLASVTSLIPATFPERTGSCPAVSGAFAAAGALEDAYFVYGTAADILDRHGFVAAWSECNRVTDAARASFSVVVELADPAGVQQAAEELAAAGAVNGFAPVSVPGFEGPALAAQSENSQAVLAFVPVGGMLAICYHTAAANQGLTEIGRLISDQTALLQGFRPTAPADLPDLPADPQGLAALVGVPPGDPTPLTGPYDLEGSLRLASDPVTERELLTANHLAGFYLRQGSQDDTFATVRLWSFSDQPGADAAHAGFVQLDGAGGGTPFTVVTVPDASCFSVPTGTVDVLRCRVHARTHLAAVSVSGPDETAARATMETLLRDELDLIGG